MQLKRKQPQACRNVERLPTDVQRPSSGPATDSAAAIAGAMTKWFLKHARDLPWRRTLDPYAIWISEIMLQQTQVKTVIPYYLRWLRELPDPASLAQAGTDRVLKLWEGLGYYTRARNLQKAAQQIQSTHGGSFPENFEAILDLPGVGRYTAGAIASIAFNQPAPILDGNVIRVLTRLFGIVQNPRETKQQSKLWHLAAELVAAAQVHPLPRHENSGMVFAGSCSVFNQSLMELGATVCTPRQPACNACPLKESCVALREGLVDKLPMLPPRSKPTEQAFIALVMEREQSVLVRQRPESAVNARLWEFPNAEISNRNNQPQGAVKNLAGFKPGTMERLCTVRHSITRYRITVEAYRVRFPANVKQSQAGARWVTREKLPELAFTSAHRKILTRYLEAVGLAERNKKAGPRKRSPAEKSVLEGY